MLDGYPVDTSMWGYSQPADDGHHGWECPQSAQYYEASPDLAAHNGAQYSIEEGGDNADSE